MAVEICDLILRYVWFGRCRWAKWFVVWASLLRSWIWESGLPGVLPTWLWKYPSALVSASVKWVIIASLHYFLPMGPELEKYSSPIKWFCPVYTNHVFSAGTLSTSCLGSLSINSVVHRWVTGFPGCFLEISDLAWWMRRAYSNRAEDHSSDPFSHLNTRLGEECRAGAPFLRSQSQHVFVWSSGLSGVSPSENALFPLLWGATSSEFCAQLTSFLELLPSLSSQLLYSLVLC